MNWKQIREIAEAGEKCEVIQYKRLNSTGQWRDLNPAIVPLNFGDFEYRVKPKLVELWAVFSSTGEYRWATPCRVEAEASRKYDDGRRVIHMREVPEGES